MYGTDQRDDPKQRDEYWRQCVRWLYGTDQRDDPKQHDQYWPMGVRVLFGTNQRDDPKQRDEYWRLGVRSLYGTDRSILLGQRARRDQRHVSIVCDRLYGTLCEWY